MSEYVIPVPGSFAPGVALLDLETSKVETDGFVMPNGEALRRRWRIELAGIARDGEIVLVDVGDEAEAAGLGLIGDRLAGASAVIYGATREFDEMICRGRFTNARRAHLPVRGFPAVPGAEYFRWVNIGPGHSEPRDPDDLPSREVSATLRAGGWARVAVHNLRDVAELILVAGKPDATCATWCRRVLADYCFSVYEIYGSDE